LRMALLRALPPLTRLFLRILLVFFVSELMVGPSAPQAGLSPGKWKPRL
jgi:hypothetical protein